MSSLLNRIAIVYNKIDENITQKTGILLRIPDYLTFSFDNTGKKHYVILPSGTQSWQTILTQIQTQLNTLSTEYFLGTLGQQNRLYFTISSSGNTLTISAQMVDINDAAISGYDYSSIIAKISTTSANSPTLFTMEYDREYMFSNIGTAISIDITTMGEYYSSNDIYLLFPYHDMDKSTLTISAVIKQSISGTVKEVLSDFMLIGFDVPTDIALAVLNTSSIDTSKLEAFGFDVLPGQHWSEDWFGVDMVENNRDIPIGTKCQLLGNSDYDNDTVSDGYISDNRFSGMFGDESIPESILVSASAYNGYSGAPVIVSNKVVGMVISGIENKYFDSVALATSSKLLNIVVRKMWAKYATLTPTQRSNTNTMTREIKRGFEKAYLGIKNRQLAQADLVKYNNLRDVFKTLPFGGLWIENFIKGYDISKSEYVYDILEGNKKDIIGIDSPFAYTKMWEIFHKDLSSNVPILLLSVYYYNSILDKYIKLDFGKFRSEKTVSGVSETFNYYDIKTNENKSINFYNINGYTGQRTYSEFIYEYWKDTESVFNNFVITYAYFHNNIWEVASEEVIPYKNKYLEYAIIYPSVLFGYERVNSLVQFSSRTNLELPGENKNDNFGHKQIKLSYA